MLSRKCWTQPTSALSKALSRRHYSGLKVDLSRPVQSYISRCRDPYINLSIEHYLLQHSAPDSVILFQYINRPSIIIGRNQNPWLEVNLGLLKAGLSHTGITTGLENVDLVRRRSGGGTVFHDDGNVNWTVICPSSIFTRDKHAEIVVRALRSLGVSRSRVNERHDIVLDQGSSSFTGLWGPQDETHSTPWQSTNPRSLKVSGSAYKLTRHRALHHGTALLNSPNLSIIPQYLHSPAKAFIKGRGVESVSSPVGNILLNNDEFIEEVQREFGAMYGGLADAEQVDYRWLEIDQVEKGWRELRSPEWTYAQTPQFTLSNRLDGGALSDSLQTGVVRYQGLLPRLITSDHAQVHLNVKNGTTTDLEIELEGVTAEHCAALLEMLEKCPLHGVHDWPLLFHNAGLGNGEAIGMARWVRSMLPVPGQASNS